MIDTDATPAPIDVLAEHPRAARGAGGDRDQFRARTGLTYAATYRSTNMALQLIGDGMTADMAIVTREALERLVRDGIIVPGSTADLAQSGVGIAVPAGAAQPDIGNVAALRQTLLDARSIAFSRLGASGIHFADVIAQLGIADEVRRKAKIADSYVGELAARGEAELAVQQISELADGYVRFDFSSCWTRWVIGDEEVIAVLSPNGTRASWIAT